VVELFGLLHGLFNLRSRDAMETEPFEVPYSPLCQKIEPGNAVPSRQLEGGLDEVVA